MRITSREQLLLHHNAKVAAPFLFSPCFRGVVALRPEIWLSSKFQKTEEHSMGFNYASEKKKFEKKWAMLRQEYKAAGMSETATMNLT